MGFQQFSAAVRSRRIRVPASLTFLGVVLTGCTSAPQPEQKVDFAVTLNKYYEGRPMCLWPQTVKFPIDAAPPDQVKQLGLGALADAGLLVHKPSPDEAKRFELSTQGKTVLNPDIFTPGAGNFCYGRRKVISIDTAKRATASTMLVSYHYNLPEPADWVKAQAIQTAFPEAAQELAGPHRAEATMLDTTAGWEVSGTPTTVAPGTPEPVKTSSLLPFTRQQ